MATPAIVTEDQQACLAGPAPCTREQVIHGLANAWRAVSGSAGRRLSWSSSSSSSFKVATPATAANPTRPLPAFRPYGGESSVPPQLLLASPATASSSKRWQPRWPSFNTSSGSSSGASSRSASPALPLDGGYSLSPPLSFMYPPVAPTSGMVAPTAGQQQGGAVSSSPSVRLQNTARLWSTIASSISASSRRANGNLSPSYLGSAPSGLEVPRSMSDVVSSEAAAHMVYSLQEYHYKCLKHSILLRIKHDQDKLQQHALEEGTAFVDCLPQDEGSTHELVRTRTSLSSSAFYVIDLSIVVRQFCAWRYNLPLIEPRFSLQAHADPVVLKTMTLLGVKVCCSSLADLQVVKSLAAHGYSPVAVDIKPCKTPSLLAATLEAGVRVLTVDTADEVERISRRAEALGIPASSLSLIVRMRGPTHTGFSLGATLQLLPSVLAAASSRGLAVTGVSVDVRHFADQAASPLEGLITAALCFCRSTIAAAGEQGVRIGHVSLLGLDKMLMGAMLQATIVVFFPPSSGVSVSVDATAHLVDNSATLVTRIIGKRSADFSDGISRGFHYYLDDGCYGSLGDVFLHKKKFMPSPLSATGGAGELESVHLYPSTLWGPTCDGLDCIDKMTTLPEMDIGDWIYFRNVGSMAFSARTHFNGLKGPRAMHVFTGVGCTSRAA